MTNMRYCHFCLSFSRTFCPTRGLLSEEPDNVFPIITHDRNIDLSGLHWTFWANKFHLFWLYIFHIFYWFTMLIAYSIFKTSSLAFTDHWLISSILTQCSFRSNRGSWQPWCTLLALPYRRLRVRRRQCRRPSSCSRSSDTTGGLHCHRHMRQPGNIAKNDIGKGAKFFSWLCKDL